MNNVKYYWKIYIPKHIEIIMPLKVIDLYCGIGGWATGFKTVNKNHEHFFDTIWAIDMWDKATETYAANHPETEVVTEDIMKIDIDSIPKADVVVGSPPCVSFSSSNRLPSKNVNLGVTRVERFFEIVQHIQPKYWAMENVKTFLRHLSVINGIPEEANSFVLIGTDYNIPQKRHRAIITNLRIPEKRITDKTLMDIVTTLPPPTSTDNPDYKKHHRLIEVKEQHIGRLFTKKLLKKGAGRVPFPDPLSRPSRTVVATASPVGRETIVILDQRYRPDKLRYLTAREALLLQGFPENYEIVTNSNTTAFKMAGNAFPPTMAQALAETIIKEHTHHAML